MHTGSLSLARVFQCGAPGTVPGTVAPLQDLAARSLGKRYWGPPGRRTYSVSESSKSDTAGTTLSTGVHAGLTQERPRWMTSCTYLGNNRVSEPQVPGRVLGGRWGRCGGAAEGPQTGRWGRGPQEAASSPDTAQPV